MNWVKEFRANKNNKKILDELGKLNLSKKNIVVLTGAGISKEAGIETFRENGVYDKNPELLYKLRPDTYETDPEFLYNYYNERRNNIQDKQPTAAHLAISKHNIHVVTQNVDDLHERAGSKNIIHVHGDLNSSKCLSCKKEFDTYFNYGDTCKSCNGNLRHNIVLFKESVTKNNEALQTVLDADILIQIGSSGVIYPVAGYINEFNMANWEQGKITICIDITPPMNVGGFDYFLEGKSSKLVVKLLQTIFKN